MTGPNGFWLVSCNLKLYQSFIFALSWWGGGLASRLTLAEMGGNDINFDVVADETHACCLVAIDTTLSRA